MKKAIVIIASLLAAVIGAIFGRELVQNFFDARRESAIVEALDMAEREVNASAPMMVDEETRLERAESGPGNRFTYVYTLVSLGASEIDPQAWERDVIPQVRNNIKEAKEIRYMFEAGTTVVYRYFGRDGVLVDEVIMTPAEVLSEQ